MSHGGQSCDNCRYEHPVRFTYKITSTTRRRACLAGCPAGRTGTIDAINSHCASVRSDGYGVDEEVLMNHHIEHISHANTPKSFPTRSYSKRSEPISGIRQLKV